MASPPTSSAPWPTNGRRRAAPDRGLRWRIVGVLVLVALIPLGLVSGGSSLVFGGMLENRSLALQRQVVESHATAIDRYLKELLRALEVVTRTHGATTLTRGTTLQQVFDALQDSHPRAFVDLGVIGPTGEHLAYVGPYDLKGHNYRDAEWFRVVMARGVYVSDVFLGFRQVPHCVIAVKGHTSSGSWILRATVNSETFNELVRTGRMGQLGDAYILNLRGQYQTPPRRGRVLETSTIVSPKAHQGVLDERLEGPSRNPILRSTTWLNNDRWMLVVEQDEREVKAPVRRALTWGVLVVLIAVGLLVVTVVLATWHLTSRIDRANQERDEMHRDLLRSAKLASLGEMAAGLAHEINNPLAVISAETTNLGDHLDDLKLAAPTRAELEQSLERFRSMVRRCSGVTSKMLQFGRHTEPQVQPTHIAPLLQESVRLLQPQARVRNVELQLTIEPHLPQVVLDATELEQVLANLINNAMDAISGRGTIGLTVQRAGRTVRLRVTDSGSGIPPADLERVFQPFFTTKPIGKGTGLGLSVCYGIVHGWGGTIEAESTLGAGTTMTIVLPVADAAARAPHPRREGSS